MNFRKLVPLAAVALVGLGAMAYVPYHYLGDSRARADLWQTRWQRVRKDPAGRGHYEQDNARLRSSARVPGRVVFLGASVTEGMDLARLFPAKPYVNRGVSGQLLWQEYLRLPDDVISLGAESVIPEVCATNFEDDAPSPEDTRVYYTRLIEQSRAAGVRPVLATVLPVTRGYQSEHAPTPVAQRIAEMNRWIRETARAQNLALVDWAQDLADPQGYLPDSLSDDGLHPNAAGYSRMAQTVEHTLGGTTSTALR